MTFDFKTYQEQALTTALPSALTMDYLAPGLIAELGEVFGKQAKAVRDDWDEGRVAREELSELADCLWFIAVIAHVLEIPGDAIKTTRSARDPREAMRAALEIMDHPYDFVVRERLVVCLAVVEAGAWFYGSTLEAVAQANLDKLASRQARGVLGGSGDTR